MTRTLERAMFASLFSGLARRGAGDLAAVPAIAVCAGNGAARASTGDWPLQRTLGRVTAAVVLIGTIVTAFHNWRNALG